MGAETNANHRAEEATDLAGVCRIIFGHSSLPIAMVEEAKHIARYVNSAFCRMVGKSEDELVGRSFAEIVPEDGCLSVLDRVFRTGEAETHTEPEQSDARPLYWSYSMWPILGANERPVAVMIRVTETTRFHENATAVNQELLLAVVRQDELVETAERLNAQLQLEITERKRMEEALLNSEKLGATTRLASTMAHEINNPLGAITNLIYLLTPLQTAPEAKTYIATLDDQVRGLTRIATQMLKFHRDSNLPTEFKLGKLLAETSDFYRPQAERQRVVLDQRIESDGVIVGFRGEIIQVVTNLLLNALEATPAGGKICIHLYPAPRWLCEAHRRCGYCISIADTGSGIEAQYRARIFEPFFTTKGDKGTGLGLWLCRGIVDRVGGSIRVWSRSRPGCSGTCFSVFLPAAVPAFTPLRRRYEREQSACQTKES